LLLMVLAFVACSPGGCPADPGGPCTPGQSECRGDYYCSVGGVCTKACGNDVDCNATCETAEDCGGDWACQGGACTCVTSPCPEEASCIDGHCQRSCASTSTCTFDPYAPRS
jgi:hypothetical protein